MTGVDAKNIEEMVERSDNARITELTLLGDRNILINIATLLAYIRNGINTRKPMDIRIGLNKSIGDSQFEFLVNNSKTDDLIAKESLEIN